MFSVTGLLLLKIGATKSFSLSFKGGNIIFNFHGVLIAGLALYLMALVTSLIAMKTIDLSVFYPVSAGLGYVLVCLLSYFVLKEAILKEQMMGMILVFIGIVLMNIKR